MVISGELVELMIHSAANLISADKEDIQWEVGQLSPWFKDICCLAMLNGNSWLVPEHELGRWYEGDAVPILVSFGLIQRGNWPRKRPVQIRPVDTETSVQLLRKCFLADDPGYWKPVTQLFLPMLDTKAKAKAIIRKLEVNKDPLSVSLLLPAISNNELLVQEATPLYKYLSCERRWEILEEAVRLEAPGIIINGLMDMPERHLAKFWHSHPFSIAVMRRIIPFALRELRETFFTKAYAKFIAIEPLHLSEPTVNTEGIIRGLTNTDRKLARLWAQREANKADFGVNLTRMLSARTAEKAAAEFFRQLGFTVEDVAAQQLSEGDDWKAYDLLIQGQVPVDVKNARAPINNPKSYVEHLVPGFKYDRNSDEVRIVGVLSPFLWLSQYGEYYESDYDEWEPWPNKVPGPTIILGSTRYNSIRELEQTFGTTVLKLKLRRIQIDQKDNTPKVTIPPWVFEYPDKYYEPRQRQIELIRQLEASQLPSAIVLAATGRKPPLAAFIAAGVRPPEEWLEALKPWQIDFMEQLLAVGNLTLPTIFLAILRHFISVIGNHPPAYNPKEYRAMLYWSGYPLGRRDPLQSIHSLCQNLGRIWAHRELIGLSKYVEFEFRGLGILKGRRAEETYFTTLIAYCGGYTDKKVRCGYPDLILRGQEIEECPECHRLICPRCGYCNEHDYCSLSAPRQAALASRNRKPEEWETNAEIFEAVPQPELEQPTELDRPF